MFAVCIRPAALLALKQQPGALQKARALQRDGLEEGLGELRGEEVCFANL